MSLLIELPVISLLWNILFPFPVRSPAIELLLFFYACFFIFTHKWVSTDAAACPLPPADPGESGGGASEGGGGAAGPVAGPQPGGQRLRGGGRPEDQRGEEVPVAAGAAAEETRQPDGLQGDPPVQQGRGGRDCEWSIRHTGQEVNDAFNLLTSVGCSKLFIM